MKRLKRLLNQAGKAATFRRHELGPWLPLLGGRRCYALCRHCGMRADVVLLPAANECEVSGPAVALCCLNNPVVEEPTDAKL